MSQDTSRAILAANLRRMIEAATSPGDRPSVRAWALARGLNVRLIDRLVKGQHAVTLDSLETIASACGLKPWHLLYEHLNPVKPPDEPISEEDRRVLRTLRKLLDEGR